MSIHDPLTLLEELREQLAVTRQIQDMRKAKAPRETRDFSGNPKSRATRSALYLALTSAGAAT